MFPIPGSQILGTEIPGKFFNPESLPVMQQQGLPGPKSDEASLITVLFRFLCSPHLSPQVPYHYSPLISTDTK